MGRVAASSYPHNLGHQVTGEYQTQGSVLGTEDVAEGVGSVTEG